jgi:outer membrane protein
VKKNLVAFFVLFLFGCSSLFAQKVTKIGYIDSQTILNQMPEAIKAQGEIQTAVNNVKSQIDSLQQLYQQTLATYQKQANMMTDAKKKEAQQRIMGMENDYNTLRGKLDANGDIAQLNKKLMDPIIAKIKKVVKEVANKEGIQLVLENNEQVQSIWYAESSMDLTYKVLDKLKTGK